MIRTLILAAILTLGTIATVGTVQNHDSPIPCPGCPPPPDLPGR